MPTSVENLASYLSRALSLDSIDSTQAQATFTQIDKTLDAGLSALNTASTPQALFAAERQYGQGFFTLGAGVAGLGENLENDGRIFYAIDQYLGGGSLRNATGTQADFATFETQWFATSEALESFGADFAHLAFVSSHSALTSLETQLGADANTLKTDFAALGGDSATLVGDLLGVTTLSTANLKAAAAVTTQTPYQALGFALLPFVQEFGGIGYNFGQLSNLFGDGGGSGTPQPVSLLATTTTGGGGTPTVGSVFAALDTAFVGSNSVDSTLQGLGAPIANLLLPAVTPPTTVAT